MRSELRPLVKIVAGHRVVPPVSYPSAIAGHGPNSIADKADDPLEINAVLLVGGGMCCLLVSFDLLYIGGALEQDLRRMLTTRYGLQDRDVFLFASHTHFAPPTDPGLPALGPCDQVYVARVTEAVLSLADELIHKPPASIHLEVRRGELSHSVNRRRPRVAPTYTHSTGLSFARVTSAPYARGLRDDTATLLTFVNAESHEPIAIIWHYACHPVSHTPSNVTSADFPGVARSRLRDLVNKEVPVLYLQGFCGDLRPNVESGKSGHWRGVLRALALDVIAGSPPQQPTESAWRAWVTTFGDQLVAIAASAPVFVDEPRDFASECVNVPVGEFFDGTVRRNTMHIRGLRLGGVEALALGAEPSVGWQQRLTSVIGEPEGLRLYIGYCGDVIGYLPLPEQVDEGGYEVHDSQVVFGSQGQFRAEALQSVVSAAVESVVRALRRQRPS